MLKALFSFIPAPDISSMALPKLRKKRQARDRYGKKLPVEDDKAAMRRSPQYLKILHSFYLKEEVFRFTYRIPPTPIIDRSCKTRPPKLPSHIYEFVCLLDQDAKA